MADTATHSFAATTAAIPATLGPRLARVGAAFRHVVKVLSHARMIGVLSDMSNAQLAQIGITRSQIPAHAAMLVGLDDH